MDIHDANDEYKSDFVGTCRFASWHPRKILALYRTSPNFDQDSSFRPPLFLLPLLSNHVLYIGIPEQLWCLRLPPSAFLAFIRDATSHSVQCGDIVTSLLDDSLLWASLLIGAGNRWYFMRRPVIFAIFRGGRINMITHPLKTFNLK